MKSAVYWACDKCCEWTGHAGGCWILRHPLRRLWYWANDVGSP